MKILNEGIGGIEYIITALDYQPAPYNTFAYIL